MEDVKIDAETFVKLLPTGPAFTPKIRKPTEARARMVAKQISKRRAKNKRAKKARRKNRKL